MKKLLYSSLAIAAMAVSCQEAELENNGAANNGEVFRIEAPISETKTTFTEPYSVEWASDDELSVIINSADGYKFTKSSQGDYFETTEFTPDAGASYTYDVIYPYNSALHQVVDGFTTGFVEIPVRAGVAQIQSETGNTDHVKGPLYGHAVVEGGESPVIAMLHLSTLFKITVTNPSSEAITIQSITLSADDENANLCGTFYVNTQTGELNPSGSKYVSNATTLSVKDGTIAANGAKGEFWIVTAPFAVNEGSNLTITILAEEGEIEIVKPADAGGWNFEAGKINSTEVTFKGAEAVDYMTVTEALSATGKVNVEGIVMAKNAKSYILADETSYVLAYRNASPDEVNVGDRVRISGEMSEFNDMAQITSPIVVSTVSHSEVSYPEPEILGADAADALVASPEQKYIQFTGMLNISGSYYNVTIDGASSVGSISYPADDLSEYDGKAVTITGYFNGVSGGRYLNILYTEIEEAPYCTVSPATLSVGAETGTTTFNISSNESWTISTSNENYKLSETSGNGDAEITVTYPANETDEAITVTFTVKSESGNDTVILTQRGAGEAEKYYVKVTSEPADWSGRYLIVCDDASKPQVFTGTFSGSYVLAAEVTIDNNNITSDPTIAGYEVTIAKDGDHYSISCSAGYIGWTGSGNNITSSSSVNSDNYRWDISVESGIMNVQLGEGANRYLHFNNSANPKRFTCYKASSRQMEVSLYKLAE